MFEELQEVLKTNLDEIRNAMNDIGVGLSDGVTLADWELWLRTVTNDPFILEKPKDVQTPVGRGSFLIRSLINLRQAINDLQDDTLVRGIPLEEWPDYIRKIQSEWTGCRTYVIRLGDNLGDISIAPRRMNSKQAPDAFYSIYVDNGIVKTATKDYHAANLNYGWVDQHNLGSGRNVALAFDGYWERYQGTLHLVTSEVPYIFWTDLSKNLYRQVWGQPATKALLAEGVTNVKAIRAWKNFKYSDQDWGIICSYIKTDGTVWYRSYAEQSNNSFIWEQEEQVVEFTGTAISLNLFITNDYRTGIIVEDSSGDIHWHITARNWAGMALTNHHFPISSSLSFTLSAILYPSAFVEEHVAVSAVVETSLIYAGVENSFTRIENKMSADETWGKLLEFSTTHPIFGATNADFELVGVYEDTFTPIATRVINSHTYELEFIDFNNADTLGTLRYLGVNGLNIVDVKYAPFSDTFTPINLVPVFTNPPEVEAIWNE